MDLTEALKTIEKLEKALQESSNREGSMRRASTKWMQRCFEAEEQIRDMRQHYNKSNKW